MVSWRFEKRRLAVAGVEQVSGDKHDVLRVTQTKPLLLLLLSTMHLSPAAKAMVAAAGRSKLFLFNQQTYCPCGCLFAPLIAVGSAKAQLDDENKRESKELREHCNLHTSAPFSPHCLLPLHLLFLLTPPPSLFLFIPLWSTPV